MRDKEEGGIKLKENAKEILKYDQASEKIITRLNDTLKN